MSRRVTSSYRTATLERLRRRIARGGERGVEMRPEFFDSQERYGVTRAVSWELLNELSDAGKVEFYLVTGPMGGNVVWARVPSRKGGDR